MLETHDKWEKERRSTNLSLYKVLEYIRLCDQNKNRNRLYKSRIRDSDVKILKVKKEKNN